MFNPSITESLPLFAGLSTDERDGLVKGGILRRLQKGEHIFLHGDPVNFFYVILSGSVQLFRETPDGYEKTIELMHRGQNMAVSEIMDACRTYRANARALEDTQILEYPATRLKEMAKSHGAIALNLLSQMSEQAHLAELEAEHQATMSAAQMVACFLQRLCILHDFNPQNFDLPYSKTLIASRLGMEIETFSRTLAKLRDHGISVTGSHVSIHDLGLIAEYACQACSVSRECTTHQKLAKRM